MNNKEILEKAIQKAIDNGWNCEYDTSFAEYYNSDTMESYPDYEVQIHLYAIIFDHDFAKALWGKELTDKNGYGITAFKIWAKQVAVKHLGKIYVAEPDKPFLSFEHSAISKELGDLAIVNSEHVEYKLKDLFASIPFDTHSLQEIDVVGDLVPKWQYHLQQMVIADDPIAYLRENI